jgi:hypothetical protein
MDTGKYFNFEIFIYYFILLFIAISNSNDIQWIKHETEV